jgi:hypothetical protein
VVGDVAREGRVATTPLDRAHAPEELQEAIVVSLRHARSASARSLALAYSDSTFDAMKPCGSVQPRGPSQ